MEQDAKTPRGGVILYPPQGPSGGDTKYRLNCKNLFLTFPQCERSKLDLGNALEGHFKDNLLGYMIAQETHEDGQHHLHAYVTLKEKINYKDPRWGDQLLGQHGNYQSCRSIKKTIIYLKKEDPEPLIWGVVLEDQNWRDIMNAKDWTTAKGMLAEWKPRDILMNLDRIRSNWYQHNPDKRPGPYQRGSTPEVAVFFGKAGVGKTYNCEEYAIEAKLSMGILSMEQLKKGWFAGWGNEDICLLDDFRGDVMKPHEFLNFLDNKNKQAPIKGGYINFSPKYIFITSSDHPYNWWPHWVDKDDNNWNQLRRRITTIYHCKAWKDRDEIDRDSDNRFKVRETLFVN